MLLLAPSVLRLTRTCWTSSDQFMYRTQAEEEAAAAEARMLADSQENMCNGITKPNLSKFLIRHLLTLSSCA